MQTTQAFPSKLPQVGTTIFTVMSKLAADTGALNLSQGYPNFNTDPVLIELVAKAMRDGYNQYAPMPGVPVLREAIAQKTARCYNVTYNPETEITVTTGATEAIYAAITTVVQPDRNAGPRGAGPDEVIVFEPAYDSYVPAIELSGGKPVFVSLNSPGRSEGCIPADAVDAPRVDTPGSAIDWDVVRGKITERTRLIIVNTPHNPTGYVWSADDLNQLAGIVQKYNLFVISDEVYEHIIFDERTHHSLMQQPLLRERTFVVGSFGKTFHTTGWKIGYCLAPANLTAEFRKVHQFVTFSVSTPMQYALAEYLQDPAPYEALPAFYQRKRDLFLQSIRQSRFQFVPSEGTFFQNVSYAGITDEPDYDLAIRLTHDIGVASIPVSVFYHERIDHKILRFCFAKDDETLLQAGERLTRWSLSQ
ncbi:methionine aminotransferase [Spirosoma luteum]|uniref:methionine aminotransferase n=1 Tax=Spirosoma luteum TaxID=431553 RepID=UPI0003763137|nr:methionine aminotransferase [Spirosoma luteum]